MPCCHGEGGSDQVSLGLIGDVRSESNLLHSLTHNVHDAIAVSTTPSKDD